MHILLKICAAICLAACVILGFFWYLSRGPSEAEPREPSPVRFGSHQLDAYNILRGNTSPLPARLQASMQQFHGVVVEKLWLETAKQVPTSEGDLWAVNGPGVTCIIQAEGGAVACTSWAEFLRHGVILGVFERDKRSSTSPWKFLAMGLAPDWADRARLKIGDREVRRVPAQDNAYALQSHAAIVLLGLQS